MARPVSKYFSSVVKKFAEAKSNENIVVDQDFKVMLRAQIMGKISNSPAVSNFKPLEADEYNYNPGTVDEVGTVGFIGFLSRWKYAVAAVPTLLLLIVVAAQFFRMPVQIDSGVKTEESLVQTGSEQSGDTVIVPPYEEENITVPEESKIITFPGESVMPSKYKKVNYQQDGKGYSVNSAPAIQNNNQTKQAKNYNYASPNSAYSNSYKKQKSNNYSPPPQQQNPPQNQYAMPVVPTVPFYQPYQQTPVNGASGAPFYSAPSGGADNVPVQTSPPQAAPLVNSAPAVDSAPAQAGLPADNSNQNMNFQIYYDSGSGGFANDEKTVFEKVVVPGLVDDKAVNYIYVFGNPDQTVRVEIHFQDGTSSSSLHSKHYQFERLDQPASANPLPDTTVRSVPG